MDRWANKCLPKITDFVQMSIQLHFSEFGWLVDIQREITFVTNYSKNILENNSISCLFYWSFVWLVVLAAGYFYLLLAGRDENKNSQASFREASPSDDDDYHHQQCIMMKGRPKYTEIPFWKFVCTATAHIKKPRICPNLVIKLEGGFNSALWSKRTRSY